VFALLYADFLSLFPKLGFLDFTFVRQFFVRFA